MKIKYTALLDLDTADAFDELAKVARRRTGKTVGKAEIMRALIMARGRRRVLTRAAHGRAGDVVAPEVTA